MISKNELQARRDNFAQVWRAYGFEKSAEELESVFNMSERRRDWLLRHHGMRDVTDDREINLRAELDSVLHGCGVLEIGFRASALAARAGAEVDFLAKILHDRQVRLFSEKRYPLRKRRLQATSLSWVFGR